MRAKQEAVWSVVLYILAIRVAGGLKDVRLVLPPVVRAGSSATFLCLFKMGDEPLYSVTWYRGTRAFYRFEPKSRPAQQVFRFPGIEVDVEASSEHQVSLRSVPLHLSGTLSCEVSADEPSFSTVTASDNLTVLDFPDTRPMLHIESELYTDGEPLTVNCTTEPVQFQSAITFYVNNEAAPRQLVIAWPGGATLRFWPQRSNFSRRGEMRLKCALSYLGAYTLSSRSVALWLQRNATESPPPVTAGAPGYCEILLLLGLCIFAQTLRTV